MKQLLPFRYNGILIRCLTIGFFSFFLLPSANSQQEPQFTKYMFNSLSFNPAYAGSKEYLSAVAIYRDQWYGWGEGTASEGSYDGRPVTQSFSLHSPISKRVGLGLNVMNDKIGARGTTSIDLAYAYRIGFGTGTLALALQAGAMQWRADWSSLNFQQPRALDSAFDGGDPSMWLPNFGAGIYYYSDKFYMGMSVPRLANFGLRSLDSLEQVNIRKWAKTYQHFYLTIGGAIPIQDDDLVFKPSLLIKSVGLFSEFFAKGDIVKSIGAPTSFDLDFSLFIKEQLWVGLAWRSTFNAFRQPKSSHDSIGAWMAFYFNNGLRIGFAYDFPINELVKYTYGSFELMLGYDMFKKVSHVESPRYF